ncbi:hypothetical protein N0B31_01935 [Salinirubellus salinus]|jgi:hypothetical protein|uniref:DUF7964 domain-containing protein n=1 Tax=Salinirubellus salinus TaxID=1364945 RepID=A0A9E7UBF8_9EURY|nr:hypothetical protein [Salinirubellus salinus]UWM55052.1 hypothetical protein N0B31_01935 [Salinirubellus salinus]
MELSSLPKRPFELAELQELNESGRFRAVLPGAVFDLEGSDRKLVPVAVLVTPGEDGRVVGVGYDFETGWNRVTSEAVGDAVRDQVEAAGERLRVWTEETGQRWAEPDGATALVDHVRERSQAE